MPLTDVELQAVADRFVAAVDRVGAIAQTLEAPGKRQRRLVPLIELDDPRRLEMIAAIAEASIELARYRVLVLSAGARPSVVLKMAWQPSDNAS